MMSRAVLAAAVWVSVAWTVPVGADTFDAVADFHADWSINPNGVWRYMWSTDLGGIAQMLAGPTNPGDGGPGTVNWENMLPQPDRAVLEGNISNSTIQFGTAWIPPQLLRLDPQLHAVFLRFTTPVPGAYAINGRFVIIDVNPQPHGMHILLNGDAGSPLYAQLVGNPVFHQQFPFDISGLSLGAGETLDFVVDQTVAYNNLSTGLSVTISGPPPNPPGDLDGDGDIDLFDYAAWSACLSGPNGGVPSGCGAANLDVDSDVDLADFALFSDAFSG